MITLLMAILFHSALAQSPTPAQNQNCVECGVAKTEEKIGPPTEHWAANDEQVKKAFCFKGTPPTEAEMSAWLLKNRSGGTRSASIKGFQFKNERPELIEAFSLLVDSPAMEAVKSSTCQNVKCAVQEVFGAKRGLQLLFMLERYGFNGSEFTQTNADAWKDTELDRVLVGLSAFPENTLPQKRSQPLIHFKRGFSLKIYSAEEAPFILANANISIFDYWDSHSPEQKSYTIVHETGHNFSTWTNDTDRQPDWMNLSGGWTKVSTIGKDGKTEDTWTPKDASKIVSTYGMVTPDEDFAETVSAYRFNPLELKRRNPEKYKLMKDVYFDGLEYTSEAACDPAKATSVKVKAAVLAQAKSGKFAMSAEKFAAVQSSCSEKVLAKLSHEPLNFQKEEGFQACIRRALRVKMVEEAAASVLGGKPNPIQVKNLEAFIPASALKPEWMAQASDQVRSGLVDSLSLAAVKIYDSARLVYGFDCAGATKYSDQYVDIGDQDFSKKFDSSSPYFSHEYQSQFNALFKQVCEDLKLSDGGRGDKISVEQAKASVSKFLK
jgi:hypothetical protein